MPRRFHLGNFVSIYLNNLFLKTGSRDFCPLLSKTLPGPLKAAYGYSRSRKIIEGKQLTEAIVVSTCIGDHSSAKRGRDAAAKHSVQITGTGETKPPLYCDTVPISNHPNRADVFSIRNLGVFKKPASFFKEQYQ